MLTRMRIGHFELEILTTGEGPPILLIHGIHPVHPAAPFIDRLAKTGKLIAPSHPGFGTSPLPPDFDAMYDLINLYHAILDSLTSTDVTVIGFSFGGWIAAELAVMRPKNLRRLILVDSVGIKIGGREERDITHFFNTDPLELQQHGWHDPSRRPSGTYGVGWQSMIDDSMSDQDMISMARNWDSLCLYAWRPHMFNPNLKQWLHRIAVPALLIWGESDRVVTPRYGRAFADLIPNAGFIEIANAGHHPELEQPDAFVATVSRFMAETGQ